MGVEFPLCVVVTILECCVTFSGVKLNIRSFVLFIRLTWLLNNLRMFMFVFSKTKYIVMRKVV